MKKKIETDKRALIHFATEGKILDFVELLVSNISQEVEFLISYLKQKSVDIETIMENLALRNDKYSESLNELLINGIFLPFDEKILYNITKGFHEVIENIEAFAHRIELLKLPDWITEHLISMLDSFLNLLSAIDSWFEKDAEISIETVQAAENQADIIHASFLKKAYSAELDFKTFHLALQLDSILESTIDQSEALAKDLVLLLKYNTLATQPPPTYLS